MPKRVISYALAVAAGLCMLIAFSTNWALAGDCLVQPNRQLAPSGHWYYRVDHVNYHKCWYRVEPTTRMAHAEVPQAQPAPDATLGPTLSSFFASLSASSTGAKPAGTQQDATSGDAHTIQTRPDDLKIGDVSRSKHARMTRRPGSSMAATVRLNRQSSVGPHVERADQPILRVVQEALEGIEILRRVVDEQNMDRIGHAFASLPIQPRRHVSSCSVLTGLAM